MHNSAFCIMAKVLLRLAEATQKVHEINCKVNKQVAEAFVAAYVEARPNSWQRQLALNTPLTA